MTTSGERLTRAMEELGWSRTRLAKESGLCYETIKRMCTGPDKNSCVYSWVTVCNTMGIGTTEILQGEVPNGGRVRPGEGSKSDNRDR